MGIKSTKTVPVPRKWVISARHLKNCFHFYDHHGTKNENECMAVNTAALGFQCPWEK